MLSGGYTTYRGIYHLLELVRDHDDLRDFDRRVLYSPGQNMGMIEFSHGPHNYSNSDLNDYTSPVLGFIPLVLGYWCLVPFCCPEDFQKEDQRMQKIFQAGFDVLREYMNRYTVFQDVEELVA